mmetsp:Transcript_60669/g.198573  ORF Transcript_60669/g.198573 Transcript_60669/m.198573 type:complete len:544 (-) Transcript_60669:82-1713(-)
MEQDPQRNSPTPPRSANGMVARYRKMIHLRGGVSEGDRSRIDALAAVSCRSDIQDVLQVLGGLRAYILYAGQTPENERLWMSFEGQTAHNQVERPVRIPAEANFLLVLVDVEHPHSAVELLHEMACAAAVPVPAISMLLQEPGQPRSTQQLVKATSIIAASSDCGILVQPSCNTDVPVMLTLMLKRLQVQLAAMNDPKPPGGELRDVAGGLVQSPEGCRTADVEGKSDLVWMLSGAGFPRAPSDHADAPSTASTSSGSTTATSSIRSGDDSNARDESEVAKGIASQTSAPFEAATSPRQSEQETPPVREVSEQQLAAITEECQFLKRLVHANLPDAPSAIALQLSRLMHQKSLPNLRHMIIAEQGQLPRRRTQNMFLQIASGLACLHQHGIAHRNLKPENILVFPGDIVKIVSYGRAVQLKVDRLCVTRCGTMPFTAPEVLAGRPYDAGCADVWSTGVILLELLCGINALPRMLELSGGNVPAKELAAELDVFFEDPARLWRHVEKITGESERGRDELLAGMLTYDVCDRWSALQARDCSWVS